MFGVTGVGLHFTKRFLNDGKQTRWNSDLWDRVSRFLGSRRLRSALLQDVPANSLTAK